MRRAPAHRHAGRVRAGRRVALVLGAAAVALTTGAAVVQLGSEREMSAPAVQVSGSPAATPTPSGTPIATPTATPDPDARVPGPGSPATTAPAAVRPTHISIPAIDVDATMTDLGLHPDGTTEVPDDVREVGWVETTPAPGEQGPAVVAAHVDSATGPAVFARLSTLRAGDAVAVTRADGSTARFTVDGVREYAQDSFPTASVYGPVPGPALRLVTCGGTYDKSRGGYQDNVVVYAS